MKHFSLFAFFILFLQTAFAQPSSTAVKAGQAAAAKFTINGTLVGFSDGTGISLLNGSNGQPEQQTKLVKGKFSFTGNLNSPDFKIITIEGVDDYSTLFIANDVVEYRGEKSNLKNAIVKGSPYHTDFVEYTKIAEPYEPIFSGQKEPADDEADAAVNALSGFIAKYKNSYITPLAIFRLYQINADEPLLEKQYENLSAEVKTSQMGRFIGNTVAENRKFPIGMQVADFAQADTTGTMFQLSALKGKYVLLDFWASWCRPCRMENPNVVNAFNQFKDRNFTILGISLDQNKTAWLDAIKMDKLAWAHVSDLKGWGNTVAATYGVKGIPQNFLIDPSGKLVAKNLRGNALSKKLSKVLPN